MHHRQGTYVCVRVNTEQILLTQMFKIPDEKQTHNILEVDFIWHYNHCNFVYLMPIWNGMYILHKYDENMSNAKCTVDDYDYVWRVYGLFKCKYFKVFVFKCKRDKYY